MKAVQMTLDEELVKAVDEAARQTGSNRSSFTRRALRHELQRLRIEALERQHREGYTRHPVAMDEFAVWETEQDWGDE
ncbi:MAG: ribbon-helix-helix protein, CopG family [Wenzhouxiangella sp.]|nr:MAG: ribbon-helix-helix protein, CopG family [Wenzhouxiangella sp.]